MASHAWQRRILQDLVYLGDEEPGKNFVEVCRCDARLMTAAVAAACS
jgi:hypothetical protein